MRVFVALAFLAVTGAATVASAHDERKLPKPISLLEPGKGTAIEGRNVAAPRHPEKYYDPMSGRSPALLRPAEVRVNHTIETR
jgi:hypothetical protein